MSRLARFALVLLAALLAACSTGAGSKPDALERTLYDYSGAIRWNNFEVAWDMVDPKVREAKPLSDFELERLKQVQITHYTLVASTPLPDGRIAREVELGVVNRHTQAERSGVMTTRRSAGGRRKACRTLARRGEPLARWPPAATRRIMRPRPLL
jgi:hypothetical protein